MLGDRWTLVILKFAFAGVRRFNGFQSALGISRSRLGDRLDRLVEHGILVKVKAADGAHEEYRLTEKGHAIYPILMALKDWATPTWRPTDRRCATRTATAPAKRMSCSNAIRAEPNSPRGTRPPNSDRGCSASHAGTTTIGRELRRNKVRATAPLEQVVDACAETVLRLPDDDDCHILLLGEREQDAGGVTVQRVIRPVARDECKQGLGCLRNSRT